MSIKSSQKSSEISVGKLRRAYKTKDLLNLSVRAKGIEYCDGFLSRQYTLIPFFRNEVVDTGVWSDHFLEKFER